MNAWLAAKKILAVRLDNAGDVVMLGPALRAVKASSPEARLTLLASPAGALAAPLLPWVDEVMVWRSVWQDLGHLPFDPARETGFLEDLRDRGFDAALIFTSFSQTPHAPGYACYLAGIPLRAGESKEFGGAVLSTELRGTPEDVHQVERNLRLVEALGFAVPDRSLAIEISDDAREQARRLLEGVGIRHQTPYLVIHPGASAAARRYPAERWGAVARMLGERGWPVLLTGVEKERDAVEGAAAAAPASAVLIGQTSMSEYAALLANAALVLSGNTLPMHLTDATRTPVLVLYSGTDLESQWAPRATSSRLLRLPTPCHPCYRFTCPFDLACLDISPEQVVAEAAAMLRPTERGPNGSDSGGIVELRQATMLPGATPSPMGTNPGPSTLGANELPVDPIGRIIAVQALGLGDFLCTTPALRALRERFPGAEITFVGSPWAEEAIRRSHVVDRYLPFPGWDGIAEWPLDPQRIETFLAAVHAERFDLAIQLHGSGTVSNGFVAALGAASTLGYRPNESEDCRLSRSLAWIENEPEPLRWLRLVALLGATSDDGRPEFPILPGDDARAEAVLAPLQGRPGPVVALHAGAKDPARRWPTDRFALLARRLIDERQARIVLTGSAGDRELTAEIAAHAGPGVLDLAGQTDLGTLAALVARCDLLVSNDTGISHLAAAVATPSVVLFGPARPERWAPLDHIRHHAIDAPTLLGEPDRSASLARLPLGPVLASALAQLAAFPSEMPRPIHDSSCEVRA